MLVSLGTRATLGEAAQIRASLLEALRDHPDVELDNRDVREVDLSFVQLVLAARSEAAGRGKTVRLTAPAIDPLAALLERGGFLAAAGDEDRTFWFHGVSEQ